MTVRPALLTVSSSAVLTAGYLGFVVVGAGRTLDQRAFERAVHLGVLRETVDVVPAVSAAAGVLALLIVALRRLGWVGVGAAVLPAVAAGLADVLKIVLPRPATIELFGNHSNSYPSGHTAATAGAVLALVLVVPPRLRLPMATAGAIWTGVIGAQLVQGGYHRPGDIVGGATLALTLGGLLMLVDRGRRLGGSVASLSAVGACFGLVLAALVLLALVPPPGCSTSVINARRPSAWCRRLSARCRFSRSWPASPATWFAQRAHSRSCLHSPMPSAKLALALGLPECQKTAALAGESTLVDVRRGRLLRAADHRHHQLGEDTAWLS